METIETERLLLRPYDDGDAERVLDIHSRLEVIRWLGNPQFVPMKDLAEARARIAIWNAKDAADEHVRHFAIEPRDAVVAGAVIIAQLPNDLDGRYEVGWHLHPDSMGHGYASEAAITVIDDRLARGLDEIWCTMYPDNEPSARVAQRIGLKDLGVRPDPWYGDDSRLFHTTREEWPSRDRD